MVVHNCGPSYRSAHGSQYVCHHMDKQTLNANISSSSRTDTNVGCGGRITSLFVPVFFSLFIGNYEVLGGDCNEWEIVLFQH